MANQLIEPESWTQPIREYDEWLRAAGRPRSTRYQRSYRLRALAVALGGDPWSVTLEQLLEYQSNEDWGAHYRRSVRSAVRAFYDWAVATERIERSPARLLPVVAVDAGKPRPVDELTYARALHTSDRRIYIMLLLGGRAGLRCCEIAQVHRDDVEGAPGRRVLRVLGKGGRVRLVPIDDELAGLILAADGYVFEGNIAGHLSPAHVSKLLSRHLPAGVTAHQLRHRFATRALRGAGGNLRVVQELLGHASIATTQIYTAVDSDELRTATLAAA